MKKASKNSTYKKVNRFSTEIDAFILWLISSRKMLLDSPLISC